MTQPTEINSIALLNTKLLENPWSNIYWFSRMLLNSDKYAGIGRDTKRVTKIGTEIISLINSNNSEPDAELVPIILSYIKKSFMLGRKKGTKVAGSIEKFAHDLEALILSKIDAYVFGYTCRKIVALSNIALEAVPSDDKEYTEEFGRSIELCSDLVYDKLN